MVSPEVHSEFCLLYQLACLKAISRQLSAINQESLAES
jgi:hypothetical protein